MCLKKWAGGDGGSSGESNSKVWRCDTKFEVRIMRCVVRRKKRNSLSDQHPVRPHRALRNLTRKGGPVPPGTLKRFLSRYAMRLNVSQC